MSGRVLALDYGEKRIGLALSDPLRIIASPFEVLRRVTLAQDLDRLAAVVEENDVVELVIGLPANADGSHGEMVRRVEAFAAHLQERLHLPIHFVDESYSSIEADELLRQGERDPKKRKSLIDKVAAQIILRTFLDS